MFDATIDHIDETSASLSGRSRPQVANHVRSLTEQTLDALLRIEELLERLVNLPRVPSDIDIAEISTKSPAEIIEGGYSKPKGKRK